MEGLLGVRVVVGRPFRSPLRKDRNPSCVFSYHGGRLRFRDWTETTSKDIFDIASSLFGTRRFDDTLNRLAQHFDIWNRSPRTKEEEAALQEDRASFEKSQKSRIQVLTQSPTQSDISYLMSFHLTGEICSKYRCFSLERVWLNGEPVYNYRENDPAIGYYFGNDAFDNEKWKIYFYKRHGKDRPRFISNTNRIAGWVQIPDTGNRLIITKSMKDVMVLDRLGYDAIAMQSETLAPYPEIVAKLQVRFNTIFSLYDFDRTGVRMANKLRRSFGIEPLFITNGRFGTPDYGSKDISDYVRENGVEAGQKLVQSLIQSYGYIQAGDN